GVTAKGNIGAITAKALTLTPITDSKQYDGLITSTAAVTVAGNVAGDTVTVAEEYASKNVLGLNGSTLGIKAGYSIVDGASANMSGNYTITDTAKAAGTITAKAVDLAGTRGYDATANFTGGGFPPTITGTVGGQTLTIVAGGVARCRARM